MLKQQCNIERENLSVQINAQSANHRSLVATEDELPLLFIDYIVIFDYGRCRLPKYCMNITSN